MENKIIKYLKKLKHPEIENYGLNCDAQLWADFNKELRIREFMYDNRETNNHYFLLKGQPLKCNFDEEFNEFEREYAMAKLSLLVQKNIINSLTYEYEKE